MSQNFLKLMTLSYLSGPDTFCQSLVSFKYGTFCKKTHLWMDTLLFSRFMVKYKVRVETYYKLSGNEQSEVIKAVTSNCFIVCHL